MLFFSHMFFKKSELILGLGWHAAHIEQTKVVRQFKDYPKCVGKTFSLGCYWDLSFQEDFQTCLVSAKLIISLCGIWFFSFYSLSGILRYM